MSALMKDLRVLAKEPLDGITVKPSESLSELLADVQGPVGTPYEHGVFTVRLQFGPDYPQSPPKAYFLTKMFHPNVSAHGEICVNTLKKDWSPEHGLLKILTVIRCLLIYPNAESALNEEAGRLLLEDYGDYAKRARMWTDLYARRGEENVVQQQQQQQKVSSSSRSAKSSLRRL
jgi:ubiquitin-conjugating enzyme E2 S